MIGVVVVCGIFYLMNHFIGFEFMSQRATAMNVAMIHTLFNIISTIILVPFCSFIENLAVKTIRGKEKEHKADVFDMLDERFLSIPAFAVEKCKDLVGNMAMLSIKSFTEATKLIENFDKDKFAEIEELEGTVDKYEDKTSTYLVKIAATQMSANDSKQVTELLHSIGDIERISDHALSIAKAGKEISDKSLDFSDKAKKDLSIITAAVTEILEITTTALINDDAELAKRVEPLEQVVDRLKRKIKNGHIARLRQGECTMELGFILSDLLTCLERISDHCSNIAACLIEITHDSMETHEYLNTLKSGGIEEFGMMYEEYKAKYYIA